MNPREKEMVARLCALHAGLQVDPERGYLIESRLAPVARSEGFASISELLLAVRESADLRLAFALVEAMASTDTAFFRDRAMFQHLFAEVLPGLAARREGRPLRIWSIGCAGGQEIYSVAMMLERVRRPGLDVELYASDLSAREMEKAQGGVYSQFEVQHGLPARMLVDHFERREDSFVISPKLRQDVRWRRVNLVEAPAGLGVFDIVMCRNVLSAMTEPGRDLALKNLKAATAPDGVLILGAAETAGDDLRPSGPGVFSTDLLRSAA